MVATVIGSRLGLEQTSGWVLGSRGQLGSSALGRAGEGVTVNAMTGNLVVTNQDEFLVGLGPDNAISRAYNSQGAFDGDNNDGWRIGSRRVTVSGGVPSRTDWDGSVVTYVSTGTNPWRTTEGGGAYDTLALDTVSGKWTWTDGDSRITETYETYDGGTNFRITKQSDTDGNSLTFTYTGAGLISRITTQDGAYTDFTWSGNNLTQLVSTYRDPQTPVNWLTQTRTRYAYDALNRLTSVTVDLSPTDNAVTDGKTYITTYTYDGTSNRVASISQTDGSRVDIGYEASGAYRVTSITQSVAAGVSRTTSYTYVSATRTDVTDPAGLITSLEYETATGRLTKITEPAATQGGTAQVREFTYDTHGNLLRVKTSPTSWTDYVYDDANGDGTGGDHNGLWTHQYQRTAANSYLAARRTYNAANAVLTDTRYQSPDANNTDAVMPGDPLTTRYAYDSENHLRFMVAANGDVTRYDYRPDGMLIRTTAFTGDGYNLTGLAWTQSITEVALQNWAANLTDKTQAQITEVIYDSVRPTIVQTVAYSTVLSSGGADGGSAATRTNYVYDQSGRLLSRIVTGVSGAETFVYDGLGRMVSSVDFTGSTTSSIFLDALGTTVIRRADGLNEISVYNRAGERVSRTETDRGENLVNLTGWPQGAAPSGTATVPGWPNPAAYANETQWAVIAGPAGREVVAIQSGQTVNNANGGGNFTNPVPVDPTRAMEFVFYFRKSDLTRHSIYFGLEGVSGTVENGTTGVDNNNPYFFSASAAAQANLFQSDRWYKVVGYVLPQGAGLVAAGSLGGVYDTTTGAKVASTTTYRWNDTLPGNPQVQARFFDYYDETNLGFSTYFYQPEIREFSAELINELLPATGTQYRYDNQGRLRVQVDPTGLATHHLYDRVGRKVAEIDGDGSLIEYKYDAADRLVATVRYATRLTPAQIASLTDAAGNPTGVELAAVRPAGGADDSWTWTVYDDAGRVLQTIDGTGATTSYAYDGASRLLSEIRYAARLTAGQLTGFKSTLPTALVLPGATAGQDRITRYFYDAAGRRIGALDAEGFFSRVVYDRAGRVIGTDAFAEKVTNATLLQTGTYAALLAEVQSPANPGNISTWSVYDGRGFLRGTVNGEGEVTLYDYSPLGHLTQVVTGRKLAAVPTSQPTLAQLAAAPPSPVIETVNYTRNGYGQVLTESRAVTGGTETITYGYDALRRLVSVTTDVVSGDDRTTLQRYDRRGRLIGQLTAQGAVALAALGGSPTKADVDQIYRRWGTTYTYDDADRLIAQTDRDGTYAAAGAKTLFFYDADGRLTHEVNALGEVVQHSYDALGRLIETREHIGRISTAGLTGGPAVAALTSLIVNSGSDRRTAYAYNVDDTVKQTTVWVSSAASAAGTTNSVTTAFGYNAFGEMASRTDQLGEFNGAVVNRLSTYARDRRGAVTQTVEDSGGIDRVTSATYDAFGRAITTTDARNKMRSNSYDRAGRIVERFDALGYKTTYEYDARGHTIRVTDRQNNTTHFTHSAFNRQVIMLTPEGVETTTTYDDRGLTVAFRDGSEREVSYVYDRNGNLVSSTNDLGETTDYDYDYADRLLETTDASDRKVSYTYDAANRQLTRTVDPAGLNLVTTYVYNGLGEQIRVTDASGVRTDYKFDGLGRTTEIIVDPLNLALTTQYRFDRQGNLTRLLEAAASSAERSTFFTYDALNRLLSKRVGEAVLNVKSEYVYDGEGNATLRRDYLTSGQYVETRFVYDAEGQLTLTVDAAGGVTRNVYDAEGRVVRTITYADALTAGERTGLGEAPTASQVEAKVTLNAALDRSNAYIHDEDGRLVFSVDAVGAVTENLYDGAGNVVRQIRYASLYTASQTPTEAQLRAWTPGNGTGARITRAIFDAANRQSYAIDPEGFVTAFVNDPAGRTIRTLRYAADSDMTGLASNPTEAQMAAWVAANAAAGVRKTQIIYDGAGRANYVVDAAGYVSRTTYTGELVTEEARFATALSVPDNSTTAAVAALLVVHETAAAKTSYGYDSAGRQITVTDPMLGVTTTELNGLGKAVKVTDPRGSIGFFYYDTAGRLTLQVDPERCWTRTTYWAGDEVATVTRGALKATGTLVVGTPPTTPAHADDAVTSFERDNLGRITKTTDAEGHFETYTLNAFGDRTSVTNKIGGTTTYTYDLRGLMVSELLPITSMQGSTPGNVVNQFQYDAFGNMTRSIEAATLSEQRITDFEYDKLDRLTKKIGEPVTVTSSTNFSTSSVTPTETIKYDAFGNVIETVDAGGARTLFYYDALNRKTGEIDALGTRRTWMYDARDNAIWARVYDTQSALPATAGGTMPAPTGTYRETTFTYDKNNRLTSTSVASLRTGQYVSGTGYATTLGTVTSQQVWDPAGNLVEVTDGRGVTSYRFYDGLGRQVAAVDGEGYLTTWARDAEGNVLKEVRYGIKVVGAVTSGRLISSLPPRTASASLGDRITDFTYDRNGRRETEIRRGVEVYAGPPDADRMIVADATITYTYDGLGNVLKKTEANGDYVDYGYDLMGRQETALASAFTDHLGASVRRLTTTAYNGWSGVTRVDDGKQGGLLADARVTTYAYAAGRLSSSTDATGFTVNFGYDAAGRVVKESYDRVRGDGVTVTEGRRYTYDALGRVTLESSASTNGTWSFGDGRGLVYNAHGEVTSKTLNGVVQETFSYDTAGRLWRSTAGDGVARYMLYDAAGRVTLTVSPVGGMANYANVETLTTWLTNSGAYTIGAQDPGSAVLTFSLYDNRGMATGTLQPFAQLSRDVTTGVYTTATIGRSRAYNAFGEVISETDGRGFTTDFIYNTMGRIIEQRSPEVAFTNEQGVVANARPTEQRRYDISGRLVATRTANGYWTSRTLLAGSGHNGEEAVVTGELFADQGTKAYGVDVFGDVRKVTDQLGFVTLQNYDKAGRLISVQHPGRAAYTPGNNTGSLVQLTDYYGYDGLGQRIQHWNSQFGTSFKEKTVYDREGRVVSQTDFESRATTYAWIWDATLTTTGVGTFGGWIKTTTHASGKVGVEKLDGFGRLTAKTDLGGRTYAMGYDQGGRQITQTSSAGQNLTWNWYNTGLMSRQTDAVAGGTRVDYAYDANGSRTRERYATGSTVRQDGYAEYDALGRLTRFEDRSANASDPTRTVWTYDLNGNIRSSQSNFRNVTATPSTPTVAGATLWNRYDGLDRMVQVEAAMTDGVIWGGRYLEYDAAGNRRRMLTSTSVQTDIVTGTEAVWVPDPGGGGGEMEELPGEESGHWEYYTTYENRPGFVVENYDYTADGYLSRVGKSQDEWNTTTDTVVRSAITWKSEDVRDAMGRLTYRWENSGIRTGVSTTYTRTATYDKAGLVLTEQTFTYVNDNIFTGVTARFNTQNTTYSYFEGSTWRGVVTSVTTTGTTDVWPLGGSTTPSAPTSTTYGYSWWDDARQATITYDSDTGSGSNALHTSTFNLDVNGRVSTVVINDDRDRTVTFVTDANGQVLTRTELDNNASLADPKDQYFYFSGRRIGEVTNNGSYVSTYQGAMYDRANTGPATPAPFQNGNYATHAIDFDLAYEALTPHSIRSGGTSWTIRDGDTLQGIAAAVWGDASLWYMIAEANGLTSASLLTAGQTITVPARVGNVHNTSQTFRPYDPNQTLGDVSPTQLKPPRSGGGCGPIGQMLMVVIAVAVAAIVAPYATAALANTVAGAGTFTGAGIAAGTTSVAVGTSTISVGIGSFIGGGAIAGAAGSIASQAFGVATGIQDKFDWKAVGMAAIAGGVGAGMGQLIPGLSGAGNVGNNFARGLARGAIGNAVTQGISVATGLQEKFDWTGVVVGAVVGGVTSAVDSHLNPKGVRHEAWSTEGARLAITSGATGAFAGAATRSVLTGTNFGDNLIAALPDVLATTIGNAIGERVHAQGAKTQPSMTAEDLWNNARTRVGGEILDNSQIARLESATAPELILESGLSTESGAIANARYSAAENTISVNAELVKSAANSTEASAALYLALTEEYDQAAADIAGVSFDQPTYRIDEGALFAMDQASSDLSSMRFSGHGQFDFQLNIAGNQQVFTVRQHELAVVTERTFTAERLLADVQDVGGSYQVAGRSSGPASNYTPYELSLIARRDRANATLSLYLDQNAVATIARYESARELHGYVPTASSGVTIASGFDIGQHTEPQINSFGFPQTLTDKLRPHAAFGHGRTRTGAAARASLRASPLTVTALEAETIDAVIFASKVVTIANRYDRDHARIHPNDPLMFRDLDMGFRTVIVDVGFNHGEYYGSSSRNTTMRTLWTQFVGRDWPGSMATLQGMATGSYYPADQRGNRTRRLANRTMIAQTLATIAQARAAPNGTPRTR